MRHQGRRAFRVARVRARLLIRKLDRETPDWLRWLTPWTVSLIFHLGLLTALGVFVYVAKESQDTPKLQSTLGAGSEDLTSMGPAEQAGDPFVTITSTESPSFSKDPEGATATATPESLLPIGPGGGISSLSEIADANRPEGLTIGKERPSVPFSGRSGMEKARLVRREGGSVESEGAVEMGLDWLARHQKKDGSWSLDQHSRCQGERCPKGASMDSDVAATGFGLLPMLGAGNTHKSGRYQKNVRRGLEWLVSIQKPSGELFVGGGSSRMYSHAIATMTLCEALGVSRDETLRRPAQLAVTFIVKSQNPKDGGWRYNPKDPGDTSVFGWQMLALRSAQLSGLKIPDETIQHAAHYLDLAATDKHRTQYGYMPTSGPSPVMGAEALLIRQYLGWKKDDEALIEGVDHVAEHLLKSNERNIYYWYYATQLLHNMQGSSWKQWNPLVRDGLVGFQTKGKGCARGSWDPDKPRPDYWGSRAGRHFTTSMSLLTLEVYYRYLPLYRSGQPDVPQLGAGN